MPCCIEASRGVYVKAIQARKRHDNSQQNVTRLVEHLLFFITEPTSDTQTQRTSTLFITHTQQKRRAPDPELAFPKSKHDEKRFGEKV